MTMTTYEIAKEIMFIRQCKENYYNGLETIIYNGTNVTKRKNNLSGFAGISWQQKDTKWRVDIHQNNKSFYVGVFTNLIDAREMQLLALNNLKTWMNDSKQIK